MSAVEAAVAALRAGHPVVLPTDTVYGLCADPRDEEAVRRMYALKGRDAFHPTAVVGSSVEALLELVPELDGQAATLRALLPGPLTLVLPNPARRLPWLTGKRPETLGVRVPDLPAGTAEVVAAAGVVAATSANLTGGRDPRRLEDVPPEVRAGCGAEIDGGEVPGVPSTVVDLTGEEPAILREGALGAAATLERISRRSA